MTYECPHLLSTPYAVPGRIINMRDDSLQQMKNQNFLTEDRYQQLINFLHNQRSSPFVVQLPSDIYSSERYIFYPFLQDHIVIGLKLDAQLLHMTSKQHLYMQMFCFQKVLSA